MDRYGLLSEITVLAKKHYGETLEPSLHSLLVEISQAVPNAGFEEPGHADYGLFVFNGPVEIERDEDTVNPFIEDLLYYHFTAPKDQPVTILFSSNGGDLDGGMAIMGVLQKIRSEGRKVHIHVTGSAQSIAQDILQVADHRSIEPIGYLMLHNVKWDVPDAAEASSHRVETEAMETLTKIAIGLWTSRTGKSYDYYRKKIQGKNWYLTAQEALSEGLVDEVTTWAPYPAPRASEAPLKPKRKRKEQSDVL